ncbi:MAG: bifunctional tRNA (5-methylaminomethyl-2-thiouridine)(34)-methyltransferase MnmD/FAD-dependent 5-carboxymethylaminomethyl-2-thiouridine(34) oxidoreductase MnmC [Alphaproteobacteria bacterium]|nr:MAG: bifunctional tRNA (5-methylaminomethyl-2-thiouridine)(34)-methyltransferase MnmD/FAD-dependent 5-carboxymethylaminomethyl-2-thiouridine(34) oxidoreductase MnmC [Alphaproteobacteria bacterium]
MNMGRSIQYASLQMQGETPVSSAYDDVYYSKAGGIAESSYVFIKAQELEQRMQGRVHPMHIAELGFGTGLNCALLADAWMRNAPSHAPLFLWSVEKHPIAPAQFAMLHEAWSDVLQPYAHAMQQCYPAPIAGVHSLWLVEGRVHLSLCFGDVMDYLPHLPHGTMDAWLLDGFSPAKNPEMWNAELLHHLGRASAKDATISTFTAASSVRRGLQEAGFTLEKIRGFGYKREMLKGRKHTQGIDAVRANIPKSVVIIGGGIAGASVAYACAHYGMTTHVLEARADVAQEASGNPAGIIYPYMGSVWDAATLFYMHGLSHLQHVLASLAERGTWYDVCGAHYYPKDDSEAERIRVQNLCHALELDASMAYPTQHGSMLPTAGWIAVPHFVRHLLDASHAQLHCGVRAEKMHYNGQMWHVHDTHGGMYHADAVVLANAYAAQALLADHALPMRQIHGQITYLPQQDVQNAPTHVVCHHGYMTPAIEGVHYIGATFDPEEEEASVTSARHRVNLESLHQRFPHMLPSVPDPDLMQGRSAFRTVSGDRLPMIGMLDNPDDVHHALQHSYHPARRKAIKKMPHLYVSLAHGARGLVSAPLAGAIIAAQMHNVAMSAHPLVMQALDPMRFMVRAWKKKT